MKKTVEKDNLIVANQSQTKRNVRKTAVLLLLAVIISVVAVIGVTIAWFARPKAILSHSVGVNDVDASLYYQIGSSSKIEIGQSSVITVSGSDLSSLKFSVVNNNNSSIKVRVKLLFETTNSVGKLLADLPYSISTAANWTKETDDTCNYCYSYDEVMTYNQEISFINEGGISGGNSDNTVKVVALVEVAQPDNASNILG